MKGKKKCIFFFFDKLEGLSPKKENYNMINLGANSPILSAARR
jgi:hypothetical protein